MKYEKRKQIAELAVREVLRLAIEEEDDINAIVAADWIMRWNDEIQWRINSAIDRV